MREYIKIYNVLYGNMFSSTELSDAYKRVFTKIETRDWGITYRFSPYELKCAWDEDKNKGVVRPRCFIGEIGLRGSREDFPKKGASFDLWNILDIITTITVTSKADTKGALECNGSEIFSFPVKKGTHVYPLYFLMICTLLVPKRLKFNDPVVWEDIDGHNLPDEVVSFTYSKKIDDYQYSTILRYANGTCAFPHIGFKVDLVSLEGICWNYIREYNIPVIGILPFMILKFARMKALWSW